MRTVPTCAAICTLSLAALASADVYVFDNAVTFGMYNSAVGLIDQQQNFNGYAGTYPSVTGGSGNFAWTASAPSGLFVNGSSVARTLSSPETLTFTFASSNVYSVGGAFYNVDASGNQQNSVMKIKLSDGTTFVRVVSNTTTFSGFASDGVNITSLEVSRATALGAGTFVASSGFVMGVVPAPGALALIGLAGLVARRRRA